MDFNLVMQYRELDRDAALFADRLRSARAFELDLFVPDIAKKPALEGELEGLQARCAALPAPDPVTQLVKQHIGDFLSSKKSTLASAFRRPMDHTNLPIQTQNFAARKDCRGDAQRVEVMITRFGQMGRVWDGVKTWLDTVSPLYLQEALDNCRLFLDVMAVEKYRDAEYYPGLSEAGRRALLEATETLMGQMRHWMDDLGAALSAKNVPAGGATSEDDCIPFEESYYRGVLWNELGVDLDELLDWHESEIEKTRENVFATMGKIKVSDPFPKTMGDINRILLKYAGPCDTPEEMFRRGEAYLKRTRAACRDYVWLPDEWCDFKSVPEHLKVSYPWGGCGGGDPKSRNPVRGEMFLNRYNFRAVTDGWIKMNTVHEAYPGHHAQFVRAAVDPLPETVKLGAKYTPIMEGFAHRSEPLFEFVFEEDPFYPLFVAYRRHHTAVRIKADLMLRYFGRPIREAVDLYVKELDFDRPIARGQVSAQEFMQGYFTTYYYGVKKLLEWEKQYGQDDKTYTETVISAGKISLDSFHKFLDLNAAQKQHYLKDFASLLQFDESYRERR